MWNRREVLDFLRANLFSETPVLKISGENRGNFTNNLVFNLDRQLSLSIHEADKKLRSIYLPTVCAIFPENTIFLWNRRAALRNYWFLNTGDATALKY